MRVLIVDDSLAMRRLEKKMLDELGCETVVEANDGLEALQIVAGDKFDLILMDWKMPVLSGLDTLKQLKSNQEFSGMPVVMVTSESQKPKIMEAIQAGAANYIIKPFTGETLKEKLAPFFKPTAAA